MVVHVFWLTYCLLTDKIICMCTYCEHRLLGACAYTHVVAASMHLITIMRLITRVLCTHSYTIHTLLPNNRILCVMACWRDFLLRQCCLWTPRLQIGVDSTVRRAPLSTSWVRKQPWQARCLRRETWRNRQHGPSPAIADRVALSFAWRPGVRRMRLIMGGLDVSKVCA